jgi:hypothetical protein
MTKKSNKQENDDNVLRIKPLLDAILVKGQNSASRLSFEITVKQQLTSVCQFCRIIEISHSIRCLLIDKFTPVRVGVPILLRNLFEGYVDLKCSITDQEYVECLTASFLKQKKKVTEQALRGNKYTNGLEIHLDLESELSSINNQLEVLEKRSISSMSIYQKFDKANLEEEYRAIYGHLCQSAHNGLGALGHRHLDRSPTGEVSLILFDEISIEDQIPYILTVVGLVLGSIDLVRGFFSLDVNVDNERAEFLFLKNYFEQ